MTTSIRSDYFFISALPTTNWSMVLSYCQTQKYTDGMLSAYTFDAQTRLTIDVIPSSFSLRGNEQLLSGTFFSERFHQHTFSDIVRAVRDGSLDPKVLTYPELLSGHDTMVVFFWPDEESLAQAESMNDVQLQCKSEELFSTLATQAFLYS